MLALACGLSLCAVARDGCDIFSARRDACAPRGAMVAQCLYVALLASPLGHYGYAAPVTQYFGVNMVHAGVLEADEWPADLSARPAAHARPAFDGACPMFAHGTDSPTCCFQPGAPDHPMDERLEGLFDDGAAQWRDALRFRLLPRCYALLKFVHCAICHPNVSQMLFAVGTEEIVGYDNSPLELMAVRLCSGFALDVYTHCRRAIYEKSEKQWIVPRGLGQRDFLRIVGHRFTPGTDGGEPLDGIIADYDLPGETCLDLSVWDEFSAASIGRWPRAGLLAVIVLVSVAMLF
jgi:hypothetical protein